MAEVDPRYYGPDSGKKSYRPGSFQVFPSRRIIDKVTKEAIGEKLKPTEDEILRRQYESELPKLGKNPSFLLKNFTSPPRDATTHHSTPCVAGRAGPELGADPNTPFAPFEPFLALSLEPDVHTLFNDPVVSPIRRKPVGAGTGSRPYRILVMRDKSSSQSVNRT